jgi:octaprenyl-diphosphate synthase
MNPPDGEERRASLAATGYADINRAADYLFRSGGKRIRPLLLILSARLCNYRGPHEHPVLLASAVEYIHAAALLHDDVLDDAAVRRGHDTARLLWGNKASILVGDYLYTRAVDQVIRLGNEQIDTVLAEACRRMVEGEMLQFSHRRDLAITEDVYMSIIDGKTATLIATTCALGAILTGPSNEHRDALTRFGRYLGLAFQIADDALDYAAAPAKLGKNLGADLCEGKITLPLLHLLASCSGRERDLVEQTVERSGAAAGDFQSIAQLMERYGSVAYALAQSREFASSAVKELAVFPPSSHRDALEVVADYVVARDH